jgi:hypothetical protein
VTRALVWLIASVMLLAGCAQHATGSQPGSANGSRAPTIDGSVDPAGVGDTSAAVLPDGCTFPSTEPAPPARPPQVAIGKPVTVTDNPPSCVGVLTYILHGVKAASGNSRDEAYRSQEGMWLLADLEAVNRGFTRHVFASELAFVGGDGTVYQPVSMGLRNELDDHLLADGERATGILFFDVPPSAVRNGKVVVHRGKPKQPYGSWLLGSRPLKKTAGPDSYATP